MIDLPRFAFVGPVNPGKTSAIATLLEEDDLRISPVPGETTECQRFELRGPDGEPLVWFYDTPGFQNPRSTLRQLRALRTGPGAPLDAVRRFVAQFGGDPAYADETRLFAPILDGAGIIYVVDAAKPVRPIHEDEMEILRLTGQPVLGLINWTAEPRFKQDWQNALRLHFRAWEFNTHQAHYAERIALLKTLIGLEQRWGPALERAVAAFEKDWRRRTRDCAAIIAEMVLESVQYHTTMRGEGEQARAALARKYQDAVRQIERDAHQRIIGIFRHRKVEAGGAVLDFDSDLFSTKTWEVLGLDRNQIAVAGAAAGAAGGAAVDATFLGHGLGLPTLLGAAFGAVGAYLGGEQLTKVRNPLPSRIRRLLGRETLGGTALQIGPNPSRNFPWILIDRALLIHGFVVRRAHAQTQKITLDPEQLRGTPGLEPRLSAHWESAQRSRGENIFTRLRVGHPAAPDDRETLAATVEIHLAKDP